MNPFASSGRELRPTERADTNPRNVSASMPGSGIGLADSIRGGLGASQDFPVDEVPECRVDPSLHLGFVPVLPEPSLLEVVLRPLEPAGRIAVAQDAALAHVGG